MIVVSFLPHQVIPRCTIRSLHKTVCVAKVRMFMSLENVSKIGSRLARRRGLYGTGMKHA